MKKIIYCTVVCCLLFPPPLRLQAQTIMHIGSGTIFYMRPGTSVALDSLVLKPSISFAFTNTDIIKSKTITHAATGNYISRVYRFSNPVAQYYSGDIKIGYLDNELNGLNENNVVIQAFTNYKWTAFRKNVSRNTNSNVVTAPGLYRISLNELTLADTLITINTPPTVSITSPANNATFNAPATITVNAAASDADGTISNVKFYIGSTYLKTVNTAPYSYTISNLAAGTYYITAKATDNSGAQTTSAAVKVIVNKAPLVRITSPANNAVFSAPATITIKATATDSDGTVSSVKFYNGSTYLKTVYTSPYTYTISNLPAGTYAFTAKATDNNGLQTTSAPVTVKVSNASIVSSKPYTENGKTALNNALSLRLAPNPANNVVNIYTSGLQQNKSATLSIISVSGIVFKTMQISNSSTSIDVSSLASGIYTIKIISGKQSVYKKFVKL